MAFHPYYDPSQPALGFPASQHWDSYLATPTVGDFLSRIVGLLPQGAMVCFEGTKVDPLVVTVLQRHATPPTANIQPDTPGENLRVFHFQATQRAIGDIAALLSNNSELRWGHHLKIYTEAELLVHWHDADTGWPLALSTSFSQQDLRELGQRLGCRFALHGVRD